MQAELEGRCSCNELQTEDTASYTLTSESQKQAERGSSFSNLLSSEGIIGHCNLVFTCNSSTLVHLHSSAVRKKHQFLEKWGSPRSYFFPEIMAKVFFLKLCWKIKPTWRVLLLSF